MTIPVSGEVLGLTVVHDQKSGMLIVLFWRPNQAGLVNAATWFGQGKWYVLIGQKDIAGWIWSDEQFAFNGSAARGDLDRRPDGVLEHVGSGTAFIRSKNIQTNGVGTWS